MASAARRSPPSLRSPTSRSLTRPATGSGTHITCEGGHIATVEDWAGAAGTTVRATDLFYNLPARRKFLGSDWRELSLCLAVFNGIALAAPQVSFRIANNERWLSTLTPTDGTTRAIELLGGDLAENLLECRRLAGEVEINGILSVPSVTRPHAGNIYFLINGRNVSSRALMRALLRGCGNHLLPRRYPVAVISINLPPHQVDANVHPRKEEVRLLGEQSICRVLESMVRDVLDAHFPQVESHFELPAGSDFMGRVLGMGEPQMQPGGITPTKVALGLDLSLPIQNAQSAEVSASSPESSAQGEVITIDAGLRILGSLTSPTFWWKEAMCWQS